MSTYDPSKVTLNIGGFFISGFSDEDIEVSYNEEDAIIEHVGIKGEYSTTEQANDSGMVKFTLKQTATEALRIIDSFVKSKLEFPVLLKDTSSGSPLTVVSDIGRIKNRPAFARGKEEKGIEVIIAIPHLATANI